ncbi:hypothetical protein EYC98_03315 [Halieaceae bacterium IMCC14734]|uniref:Uncharacterized protein n=1 Tax=Candidatus Litorirhabdus singularis TaxID=2518993 RepID=A0ABT3TEQ0_9GAMM|nr:hypothetical protein [Candidatus Litorirhabdus singularis]MCX2979889.1 hypothetical protein [Candidatus Litorirhabdus singularis]
MSVNTLGKILMTLAIAVFTFIPPLADLATDTHVFHPGWMPHARVHTVWLLGLASSVGLLALYLLWFRKVDSQFSENLAGVLGAIVYGSFFLSGLTIGLYGGALSDHEGGIGHTIIGLDLNVFTFGVATLALCAGWGLCRWGRA